MDVWLRICLIDPKYDSKAQYTYGLFLCKRETEIHKLKVDQKKKIENCVRPKVQLDLKIRIDFLIGLARIRKNGSDLDTFKQRRDNPSKY